MKHAEKKLVLFSALCVAALVFTAGCAQQAKDGKNLSVGIMNEKNNGISEKTEVKVMQNPVLGKILVDGKGMALYTFQQDSAGKSECYNQCEANWPPLVAQIEAPSEMSGDFGTFVRTDGKKQATYKGMPLYYFSGDVEAGDVNGEGFKGVWFAAGPRPAPVPADKAITTSVMVTETTSAPADNAGTQATKASPPAAGPKQVQVAINSFSFKPDEITVIEGDTVVWTNMDSAVHTVTSEPGSKVKELDSGRLIKGDTFSRTFNTPGTYSYYCTMHPMMKGKVYVQAD